jgi:SAM-dependent methyltransferase
LTSPAFRTLARDAASLYPARDRFARHFAFGKLTRDPAFEHLHTHQLVPPGARVLDLGCGQAVLAALLVASQAKLGAYTGIELMARDVDRAMHVARAAPPGCEMRFVAGDIRTTAFPPVDAVVILDVLHYIDYAAQAEVLARVREALAGGGVLLLRVGDESPSLRFRYTVAVDRLVMALRGHRLERLFCKPVERWRAELEALGFSVAVAPMSAGTPFANVLLVARYDGRG